SRTNLIAESNGGRSGKAGVLWGSVANSTAEISSGSILVDGIETGLVCEMSGDRDCVKSVVGISERAVAKAIRSCCGSGRKSKAAAALAARGVSEMVVGGGSTE